MSGTIKTLGRALLVDPAIRGVMKEHRWVTLPTREWKFLMKISRRDWKWRRPPTQGERQTANRLRHRIGAAYVETVRGYGYRLGVR